MAHQVILRRDTRCSILLSALALMGMEQVSLAQAQGTADTSLRAQYASMVRQSGKVLTIAAKPDSNPVAQRWGRFVLYAPLNRLWVLDETDAVIEHAYIEAKPEPFEHLVLHWMQWSDVDISDVLPATAQMPVFSVETDTPHPLAAAYDALLSKPLAQEFEPLPAGAYFSAGGHVLETTGTPIAEWDSYGPDILMRLMPTETSSLDKTTPTPPWQWFSVADLAAALTPKQGDH